MILLLRLLAGGWRSQPWTAGACRNLRRRHVAVAEQVFHLNRVPVGVQQKRGRGGTERRIRCSGGQWSRSTAALSSRPAVLHIALNQAVHGRGLEAAVGTGTGKSSAFAMYSEMAWAAWKCNPIVRRST